MLFSYEYIIAECILSAGLQEIRLLDRQYFKFLLGLAKKSAEALSQPPSSKQRTEAGSSSTTSSPSGLSAEMSLALNKKTVLSIRRDDKVDRAAESLINFAGQFILRVISFMPVRETRRSLLHAINKNIDAISVVSNTWS